MPTYLTVLEFELEAEHEMAAARLAVGYLRGIQNPVVSVHDTVAPEAVWQRVDLDTHSLTAAVPPDCLVYSE
jgi:hypothetical protein